MAKRSSEARDAAKRNTRGRFEQWAKNPTCEANAISVVRNVRMVDVAKAEGLSPSFGQSPFAIARGDQFERGLFREDGRLLNGLIAIGLLPEETSTFVDLRQKASGGPKSNNVDQAIEATTEFLSSLTPNSPPALVAAPTIRIPRGVMLPEAVLIIDALIIRPLDNERLELIVGEVKTYPDRGGYTSASELAVARAQAGIYVHALEIAIAALSLDNLLSVSTNGFLVLSKPGTNQPSIRPNEDLRYQAARAKRGFELLEAAALAMPDSFWADLDEATPEGLISAIQTAKTDYKESCLSFCDRAATCHAAAATRGDAVILGEETRRMLGVVAIQRALELIDGAAPLNETEQDLVARFGLAAS